MENVQFPTALKGNFYCLSLNDNNVPTHLDSLAHLLAWFDSIALTADFNHSRPCNSLTLYGIESTFEVP